MPKFDKFNTKIIFFMILLGTLLSELLISPYAFVLSLIALSLGVYISPRFSEYLQERKKKNKEKEIAKLEKRLADLRSEVI